MMPSLPLGAIQANNHCTACGECIEQCPTHALNLRDFGSNKILEFKADYCIGCSFCVDICPEQALEMLPSISLPALLTKKARPLIMVAHANISDSTDKKLEE
jgi:ferredoxin